MNIPPARFSFWWLRPTVILLLVTGTTLLLASWQNEVAYELYGMLKYIETWHLGLAVLFFAAFGTGSYLGKASTNTDQPPKSLNPLVIRRWFYLCVGLTIFGYLVWFAVGFKNGATPGMVLDVLRSDNPEFVDLIRKEYFPTIPGITTCTQFGLPAMLLGLWLYFLDDRRAIYGVLAVGSLALVRSLIFSERSAVIELGVPSTVLVLRLFVFCKGEKTWLRKVGILAPIMAPLLLAILFGAFEYVRSWRYYVDQFDSYPQFVVWRLSGYYTTSHNNGSMALETNPTRPLPFYTLRPFWEFPGVAASPFGYEKLTGIDPMEVHTSMLENYGNPELNNEGGLFQPMLDWGLPGALLFWVGYGFLASRLYQLYLRGSLSGILLYPVFFYSLLEIPRVMMICYTRLTPTLITIVAVIVTASLASKSEHSPSSSRVLSAQ